MEKSYIYPPYIRFLGILLIVLALIVSAVLIVVAFADTASTLGLLAFALLFAAVFGLFGWLMVRMHSVVITLLANGIVLTGSKRQRFIPYDQVRSLTHKTVFFSAQIIETDQGKITVRKTLVNYPDFTVTLKERVPALRREQPGTLNFRCRAFEMYISAGIFWVLCVGFVILMLVGAFTGEVTVVSTIVITVVLLPFIILLSWAMLNAARQYVFEPDRIKKISLSGTKIFRPENIKSVEYGQKKPKSGSRFGSPVLHFIDIRFEGTKSYVWADQTMTDFPIDEINDFVKKHYPVQGRYTQVSLTQPPEAS